MIRSFFILLIISLYIVNVHQVLADDHIYTEVHIIDALPNNNISIKFHCASKDNDLGWHYPKVGDDFNFHFHPKDFWWIHTLFFCHFWWGKKEAVFDVYNRHLARSHCSAQRKGALITFCYWKVQEDGFYMGPSLDQLEKIHDWN
ncbi:putative DNA-directed RNA polymerases II and IV subunit 5A-like [Capsicum annuum]|uniref:S-protein homolog n=1 Tax=Capsicum annuum TaxID=4072 RepID=A0A2G2ZJR6_CAPAN|nr:putative DNA-directed RNA polymerases II and IV subunit 5A-like [Capsicum annuum]KAF3621973.1 putative DNA-directed RNA polymerases II and IV subunit 5A-like [Capsicum annuum]PHT82216.1 hypothetical protein T459_15231 [Capsicum annuum]